MKILMELAATFAVMIVLSMAAFAGDEGPITTLEPADVITSTADSIDAEITSTGEGVGEGTVITSPAPAQTVVTTEAPTITSGTATGETYGPETYGAVRQVGTHTRMQTQMTERVRMQAVREQVPVSTPIVEQEFERDVFGTVTEEVPVTRTKTTMTQEQRTRTVSKTRMRSEERTGEKIVMVPQKQSYTYTVQVPVTTQEQVPYTVNVPKTETYTDTIKQTKRVKLRTEKFTKEVAAAPSVSAVVTPATTYEPAPTVQCDPCVTCQPRVSYTPRTPTVIRSLPQQQTVITSLPQPQLIATQGVACDNCRPVTTYSTAAPKITVERPVRERRLGNGRLRSGIRGARMGINAATNERTVDRAERMQGQGSQVFLGSGLGISL